MLSKKKKKHNPFKKLYIRIENRNLGKNYDTLSEKIKGKTLFFADMRVQNVRNLASTCDSDTSHQVFLS
jgi:disulfide oxidoreductase YuzD